MAPLVVSAPSQCRSPNPSGLKLLACAAAGTWTWYAQLGQIVSSIKPKKISLKMCNLSASPNQKDLVFFKGLLETGAVVPLSIDVIG